MVLQPLRQPRCGAPRTGQLRPQHGMGAAPEVIDGLGAQGHGMLIANSGNAALNRWTMASGKGQHELLVKGHTRTDNTAVMLSLVLNGVGIARLAELVARPLVQRGNRVPVLPERFEMSDAPLYAVMLQERHRLPKVRACIDHLAEWVRTPHAQA